VEIKVIAGDVCQIKAGAIIVSFFEGEKAIDGDLAHIDKALGGAVSKLISRGEVKGKLGEITAIHSLGKLDADQVVIMGLGKREELTLDKIRGAMAENCRYLRKNRVDDIATIAHGVGISNITLESSAQAITEGALLGLYSFRKHITKDDEYIEVKKLTIAGGKEADIHLLEQGCHRGKILAEAANLARDMVNEPANCMTPGDMAEAAKKIAKEHNLKLTILERQEMQKLGMKALLGVAQGSCQPPKFIVLGYRGRDTDDIDLALVGKGITFDSGGISLKGREKMDEMKSDMAGGAAVMAAISAIARLKIRLNVTAIVPAVENLPGGSALKPGDVLKSMIGKTIEIISTDAEGRLILADALGYANKLKAKYIVDVATLTGACKVALGDICTGVMGNNQELIDKIIAAGNQTGELMWQLPMYEEYKQQNRSDIADIKNVGDRGADTITAAQFLAEFTGDKPWVHLDIAATSFGDKERRYITKGASGVPVRTLVNLALSIANH
jgi:leucyl aminopeptidase